MFVIASGGRCGTQALSVGLNTYSDHQVEHEPHPRLLREAWLKHRARPDWTRECARRMQFFRRQAGRAYGETFRAPNLLGGIRRVAPDARILLIVREPSVTYVPHIRGGVLHRGDAWDQNRLLPRALDPGAPLGRAHRVAWYWTVVTRYLLDYARRDRRVRTVTLQPLEDVIQEWGAFLGAHVIDYEGLDSFLRRRPNASTVTDLPEGWDPERLGTICGPLWDRALTHFS